MDGHLIRFKFRPPTHMESSIRDAMNDVGARLGQVLPSDVFSEDTVYELANAALARMLRKKGRSDLALDALPDGSFVGDLGDVTVTVHHISLIPSGLMGEEFVYDVTVTLPSEEPRGNPARRRTHGRRTPRR